MIEISNLTKKFGSYTAVNNISFSIDKGEVIGFLGPNGAGKTTTMNMMTGFISSTSGSVKIDGFDILEQPEQAKSKLGYLPDTPPLYMDMTVKEYLNFVCDLKKIKKSDKKDMLSKITVTTGISDVYNRIIGNLSKGYRQRVGLAQALIGNPDVLILDEPTVGLDPKQIIEMRELIKNLGKTHTILLSSHILSEVSAICDRIIIINKGEIVADAKTKTLSSKNINNILMVTIKGDPDKAIESVKRLDIIVDAVVESVNEDNTYNLKITGQENTDIREAVFALLAIAKTSVLMMKPYSLTLEDIFLKIVNGELENEEITQNINTKESENI